MIIVSSRQDFTNSDNLLSEGHIIREVDLSNDNAKRTLSMGDLVAEINGKRICILVHGYNNEFFEVCDAYQIMESKIHADLPGIYDEVIGYTWPGGDHKLEWWDAKSRANAVARRFRQLLESLSEKSNLDIISHSLGARVSLKALKEASKKLVQNYYCMAGAIDNESLELGEEFYPALLSTERVFIMHSARDEVLATAYRAAEFDNALGLFGPEDKSSVDKSHNIFVANCKAVVTSHGAYKRSDAVFSYIGGTHTVLPDKFVTL
ncbi:alpha/beta hydrolase [Aeromonas hydrophila]|uniref:alpha/beta hydrolase n=1 Tax=Aeromonas hydrophila TaxID=644 RepID=UPI002B4BA6B8|nr:alpha/beta hydrolase [Aeromonas hydrophila]WRK93468.1 alpha/beta hydrolase [Aeromonas hydrophila]